ncbi:hypothetical protein J1N35_020063 [Gossypium stocksii]|uniref:Uncharacterized protein n=1 Tax=Gossypium stocksii TaxID=47602 RepID=A0A9D4A0I0_9ROSI|nr:hypothetical protein J1N35_020063 [Gossypium stocksii]
MRTNPQNILKGHIIDSRKGNSHSGKSLIKSIRGRGGNLNLSVTHESLSLKLWVLWQSSLVCKLEFLLQINQKLNLEIFELLVFHEYNREHKLDLISLLETRVSCEKADLIIAKLGFNNSHRVEVVDFSGAGWIEHPSFSNFVKENWRMSESMLSLYSKFTDQVKIWNKDVYGHIFTCKKLLTCKLERIEFERDRSNSEFLKQIEMDVQEELENVLHHE